MKQKNYYLDKEEFYQEIVISNEKGQLTNKAISMIQLMITHIQRPFKYVNPDDKHDVSSRALYIALKEWKKFNIEKKNAFAYFTRLIYNAMYDSWNRLNKKNSVTVSLNQVFSEQM